VPGFVLTTATVAICPHGGPVSFVPSQSRVLVDYAPALLVSDQTLVAGCPFNVSGAPSPCTSVRWTAPATRLAVSGTAVLLTTSIGLCLNPASTPQGPALISASQARVQAT
jgi:hypothetical protein